MTTHSPQRCVVSSQEMMPRAIRSSCIARILSSFAVMLMICSCTQATLRSPAPQVVAFVAPWCPHCRDLERYLDSHAIPYQRMDIGANPRAKRMLDSLGRSSIPTILVNERIVDGFDRPKLEQLLFKIP